uniref:Uncharacterized protein n=1 Tax=Heterorhabditis bacteriophora TaxID=37862 RepID=A0A1I7WLM0_HETBA
MVIRRRQQNDLPTSLSRKWSFLFHYIQQINQLTTEVWLCRGCCWLSGVYL